MTIRSLQDEGHYRKQSIRIDELSNSVKYRYLFQLRNLLVQGSISVSAREQLILEVGEHLDQSYGNNK